MSRAVPPATAFAVAALGIAVFSGMDAVMKGLVLALGVYTTMLSRSVAGVAISGLVYAAQRPARPSRAAMRFHLTRSAVATVMALLFFWGLARVPMAQAIALSYVAPLLALFLAAWLLGEKISRATMLASLVACAGVAAIVAGQARADLGHDAILGSLAILASAVCYAWNIILMRQQALVAKPAEVAFYQSLFVTAMLLLAAPFLAAMPAAAHWPAIALAAALATASMLLLSWAYARAEANFLAPVEYTSFVWAALLGYAMFGEQVSLLTVAGAAMIVAGSFLAARGKQAPIHEPEAGVA
jgi:S-adenosylmethionine uptake transporter